MADLNNLPKIGIDWQMHTETGWGLIAIHLAAEWLRQGRAFPVPLARARPLTLNPLQRRLLSPALQTQRAFRQTVEAHIEAENGGGGAGAGKGDWRVPFPLLCALGADFRGIGGIAGTENTAVIVVEDDNFSPEGLARAARFRRFLAGSDWCADLVRTAGVGTVATWHQGIDGTTFFPGPRANLFPDRFVVYSGGKLEYRKAQDLVVAAFRRFNERHPEALLVCQWATHFPQLAARIARSDAVSGPPPVDARGKVDVAGWLRQEGLPDSSFEVLDFIPNAMMGGIVRDMDVGLFPNRAEGGTNLVAMECLAAGVPCILADNTGQRDLLGWVDAYPLTRQGPVARGPEEIWCRDWRESDVDEIVDALEAVYRHRGEARAKGLRSADAMRDFGWDRRAAALLDMIA